MTYRWPFVRDRSGPQRELPSKHHFLNVSPVSTCWCTGIFSGDEFIIFLMGQFWLVTRARSGDAACGPVRVGGRTHLKQKRHFQKSRQYEAHINVTKNYVRVFSILLLFGNADNFIKHIDVISGIMSVA
jgi:hypothetical protein